MFWFKRPSYGRWMVAGVLVLVALALDASDGATVPYPFAASALRAGDVPAAEVVEWRQVPRGLLPEPTLEGGRLNRPVAGGEPILPSALTAARVIPDGWWAVPMPLPESVGPGTAVRIVLMAPPRAVDGTVVRASRPGSFGVAEAGLVAVPEADAVAVAAAAVSDELVVLVEP